MKKILLIALFFTLNFVPCYTMEKIDKAIVDKINKEKDERDRDYKEKVGMLRNEVWSKLYIGMSRAAFMNLFGEYVTKESGDYVYFSIPNIEPKARVKFVDGRLIKYEVVARSYGIPGTGYYQDSTNLLENGN
jgi:hypothetical protein